MPNRSAIVRYKRKEGSNRGTKKQRERVIQVALTRWLRAEYPNIDFFNDWASGAYLTAGQNTQRMDMASRNGWVDLFIPEPARGYMGLFIELKKEDVKIYLKDGKTLVADLQVRKEAEFLARQRQKGYCAVFACGLDNAKTIIDKYFGVVRPENLEMF
jgi:hypothetical protein